MRVMDTKLAKSLFDYNPETGFLYWKVRASRRVNPGDVAGNIHNAGYWVVMYKRKKYQAHRIAWLLSYGRWPNSEIDHINRNRSDNRLANLREVSRTKNMKNKSIYKTNTSGVVGVCQQARSPNRWMAQIGFNGCVHFLGYFDDWFDAVCARKAAEGKFNFDVSHGR